MMSLHRVSVTISAESEPEEDMECFGKSVNLRSVRTHTHEVGTHACHGCAVLFAASPVSCRVRAGHAGSGRVDQL